MAKSNRVKKLKNAGSEKAPKQDPDSTNRFLTIFLDGKEIKDGLLISESKDEAISNLPPEPKKEKKPKETPPASNTTFAEIQQGIIERMAVHRSLEEVIALLHSIDVKMQFEFEIKPALNKFATEIYTDSHRRVFSFNRIHAREILTALRKARSGITGINELPKLVLIGLVSEYDVFLRDLIKAGLRAQQSAAATISKGLSLQELIKFSSIEEAKDFVIEREIDAILYDDHGSQLSAINKLFNIDIDIKDDTVKNFLEICERRNIFTHNGGAINARYISKCKQLGIDTKDIRDGKDLTVSRQYYHDSILTIQELVIKLAQFLWRKLLPNEREEADNHLNEAAIELLIGDDYKLAERILHYGLNHTGKASDKMRRMMAVNYANAVKLLGDKDRATVELAKYDWSATSGQFQICVAAVKDDLDEVLRLMPIVVKSGELDEAGFRIWPAFKSIRSEKAFQDKFQELFGKDLIVSVAQQPAIRAASELAPAKTKPIEGHTKH